MTRLLFIHGINGQGKADEWLDAVEQALFAAGRPPLGLTPIAPKYTSILKADPPQAPPTITTTFKGLDDDVRHRLHASYSRSAARLNRIASAYAYAPRLRPSIPEDVRTAALAIRFRQAGAYANNPAKRAAVLDKILKALGRSKEDVIIVAHSLGSVVAIDLLYSLPKGLSVPLLVTAGSPLTIPAITDHLPRFEKRKGFPFDRVKAWINLVEPSDMVANGRGLSTRYPECLDLPVSIDDGSAHSATGYLAQPVLGALLGDVLHGSASAELVPISRTPDIRPTDEQLVVLLRFHYARRLELAISDADRRRRFAEARRLLLDASEDQLRASLTWGDDPNPERVIAFINNLARESGERLRNRFEPLKAVTLLLLLATSRPVDPYDISVTDEEKRTALRNVLDDLELPSDWAEHVLRAVSDAERVHRSNAQMWLKVGGGTAVVAGLAVAAAAPFILIPFAAAGTAGAAAMTSGLAGVGALVNGGMAAGVAAVTTLAAGGGLTAAAGAAAALSGGTSASDPLRYAAGAQLIAQAEPRALTATVIQLQALALLRRRLELNDSRNAEWFILSALLANVSEAHGRISSVSDKRSASAKSWSRKQETVERALDWMRNQDVAPFELASVDLDIEDDDGSDQWRASLARLRVKRSAESR